MKDLFVSQQEKLKKVTLEVPWENKENYALYLSQTYHYVKHSTRLLAAAACRFKTEDEETHRRFLVHAREENAHDVLAVRDLEALGFKLNQFPEIPEARFLYQPQYYLVEHVDPICLMGYIFALEGVSATCGEVVYDRLLKAHGKEATKFLKLHATEDHDHIEKAFNTIKGLSKEKQTLVEYSFEQSMTGLDRFFRKVAEKQDFKTMLRAA